MPTRIRALSGRPQTVWRPWLLAALVLGILGMHGLVGGTGTTAVHHAWAPGATAAAADSNAAAAVGHPARTNGEAGHGHAWHEVTPPRPADGEEDPAGSALALCLALLMALALGVGGVRRSFTVALLDRVRTRLQLPATPVLRDRTPVPRFTVMRC